MLFFGGQSVQCIFQMVQSDCVLPGLDRQNPQVVVGLCLIRLGLENGSVMLRRLRQTPGSMVGQSLLQDKMEGQGQRRGSGHG